MGRTVIGITLGDPAGIGPEIVLKALPHFSRARILLIGSRAVLTRTARKLKRALQDRVRFHDDGSDLHIRFWQGAEVLR